MIDGEELSRQRNCHEKRPEIRRDVGLFEELEENQREYGE